MLNSEKLSYKCLSLLDKRDLLMEKENIKVVPESALRFDINCGSDLDVLEYMVTLYCMRRVFLGEIVSIPRKKLISMLSMYIRYGYSKETKKRLFEIFNEKKTTNIDSWNRELRRDGFLVKDKMNENVSFLNKDLTQIKKYYEAIKGKIDAKVMFILKD